MNGSPFASFASAPESWSEPVTIFVTSYGRPLYLWQCLDALWRHTHSPARVILLDNAHPCHQYLFRGRDGSSRTPALLNP